MVRSKLGVAPMSNTIRGVVAEDDNNDVDDDDEDESLSSKTMLVPTPALDHIDTVFQCVDDIK